MLIDLAQVVGLEQLGERWRRARRAALASVVPDAPAALDDDALLARALAADEESAQRRVFANSLRLGDGFRCFHGVALDLRELPAALTQIAALDVPCLRGIWTAATDEAALRLERAGCPAAAGGPSACDWWREAISGLVLGLTGGLRHTRHDSRGHGGDRCVDVVHASPRSALRFGPIPATMRAPLGEVARMVAAFDSSFQVAFLGLSEGVLFYELAAAGCGGGGGLRPQPLIERGVRRRFPRLTLREVTPRSVLADP